MKKILAITLFIFLSFAVMVGAQSVTYDYAFTYNDTRVAFFDYYDANSVKYETRAGIPLGMTDPNDVIDYLSTPQMLELILVNIRHTEYPNLPVMDTAAEMFDPNNWCDISLICDPNGWMSDPNWVYDPNTNNAYLWCQDDDNWYKNPNDYGDPNFYLYYVAYPNNFNPNYNQAITIIDNEAALAGATKTVLKQMLKVLVKGMVFD